MEMIDEMLSKLPLEKVKYIQAKTELLIATEYNKHLMFKLQNNIDKKTLCYFPDPGKSSISRCWCGSEYDFMQNKQEPCKGLHSDSVSNNRST